jgi:glycosyltransferase involved in cell wall biosynthesis
MYDFDASRAPAGTSVRRTTLLRMLKIIWLKRYAALEIVEPYAPSALPENLLICAVARASRWTPGTPTQLVSYAIENADLPRKYAEQLRVPHPIMKWAFRIAVGFCYRTLDRLAFGTDDAQENYRRLLGNKGRSGRRPLTTRILGLPSSRVGEQLDGIDRDRMRVVFLGAFDERKGVRHLLGAWPRVLDRIPDAKLLVMGKGPLENLVTESASRLAGVTVQVDPPRSSIWEGLRGSTVLCLLSQPAPGWKEQIGLPIVEGLSFGLEIVTTNQTGISNWLAEHGHRVVTHDATSEQIARQICSALTTARPPESITADLPTLDGRLAADAWLHESTK